MRLAASAGMESARSAATRPAFTIAGERIPALRAVFMTVSFEGADAPVGALAGLLDDHGGADLPPRGEISQSGVLRLGGEGLDDGLAADHAELLGEVADVGHD